jgi:hypothetical protein
MKVLLNKLKQESTWRGIIVIAAGFGVHFSPDLQEAIVGSAVAIVGLINIIKND